MPTKVKQTIDIMHDSEEPSIDVNLLAEDEIDLGDSFTDPEFENAEEELILEDTFTETLEQSWQTDGAQKTTLDATQIYLGEIGFSPLLTAEEEVHFGRLAIKGDPAARKRMIESNLRLVVKISRRFINRGLALFDLIE